MVAAKNIYTASRLTGNGRRTLVRCCPHRADIYFYYNKVRELQNSSVSVNPKKHKNRERGNSSSLSSSATKVCVQHLPQSPCRRSGSVQTQVVFPSKSPLNPTHRSQRSFTASQPWQPVSHTKLANRGAEEIQCHRRWPSCCRLIGGMMVMSSVTVERIYDIKATVVRVSPAGQAGVDPGLLVPPQVCTKTPS